MTDSGSPTPPPPIDPVPYAGPSASGGGMFAPPPAPAAIVDNADAKLWGMLCHLTALVQFVGIPSILGPLVIWLVKKNEIPFVDDQGKEAVNFHITVMLAALVLSPTVCLAGVGIILLIAMALAAIVLSVIAAMKANSGVYYRYPFALRLIK